ncbi:D-alanyl-D-alanine carboxypeptidase [Telmatospirillum sp. J64-1]|uniref:D-alanyl-D-alanine carboxypeptidase n=1 Tax=Telmatospirillum sp. J64-1 TaxID=2502183 RepID=UPI0021041647|nr:D-alanyl-D-alanine carboxypeptidase [Telmatospirillum sp. J64-1]
MAATIFLSVALPQAQAQSRPQYAHLVMDYETGEVLSASNPDTPIFPASLTKVMTLYLLFDALDKGQLKLNQRLTVSRHAAGMVPSKLGLNPGETIAVQDLIGSLVTRSANDMAVVAAEALGGTEAKFAEMMTKRARELGMRRTTFRNASGLPNAQQKSTARDMATLARALIRDHGKYYHFFSSRSFQYQGRSYQSHNRLMLNYEGADGIKTGYIHASGFNLMSSAVRDGRRVIGVIFGGQTAQSRDKAMARLLDEGFARLRGVERMEMVSAPRKDDPLASATVAAQIGLKPALADLKTPQPAAVAAANENILGIGDADESSWGIQVGAFSQYDPANNAVNAAVRRLGETIANGRASVIPVTTGGATLFRARVIGITEDQARAACKLLESDKQSCQLVRPAA